MPMDIPVTTPVEKSTEAMVAPDELIQLPQQSTFRKVIIWPVQTVVGPDIGDNLWMANLKTVRLPNGKV